MARPEKVATRSARAVKRAADRTANRIAGVLGAPIDANIVAQNAVGQFLDMFEAWTDLIGAFSDRPAVMFMDARKPVAGGSVNATATLPEPVANLALLKMTPLNSPTAVLAMNAPTQIGAGTDIEQINVVVPVAAATPDGLYAGLITTAQEIQVEVYVWVH